MQTANATGRRPRLVLAAVVASASLVAIVLRWNGDPRTIDVSIELVTSPIVERYPRNHVGCMRANDDAGTGPTNRKVSQGMFTTA